MSEDQKANLFKTLTDLGPLCMLLLSIGTIIWSFSGQNAALQQQQAQQAAELVQVIKTQTEMQQLATSISIQLAQLQQQVADIKVNTAH
jgi:hypothetical protein